MNKQTITIIAIIALAIMNISQSIFYHYEYKDNCMGDKVYAPVININQSINNDYSNNSEEIISDLVGRLTFKEVLDKKGSYRPSEQYIEVYGQMTKNPYYALETCIHEVGHYEWYEYLNTWERQRYSEIVKNEKIYVSEYAKNSTVEDFAETIKSSIKCEWDFSQLPEKRKSFIKETVSSDFPFYLKQVKLINESD